MKSVRSHEFENLISLLSVLIVVGIMSLLYNFSSNYQIDPRVKNIEAKFITVKVLPSDPLKREEVKSRFNQATALLHAKRFEYAATALSQVIKLAPLMPEAYVNLGFAYIGLEDYESAVGSFNHAINLKAQQDNAYWGLALAAEGLKDYEMALGAMRSFIHLSKPDNRFLPRARAALWEWEAILGRVPGVAMPKSTQSEQQDGTKILKQQPYKLLRPNYNQSEENENHTAK